MADQTVPKDQYDAAVANNRMIEFCRLSRDMATEVTREHRGYTVRTKRDFGTQAFWLDGRYVAQGFIVCDSRGCNAMPGAIWFLDVDAAKRAINVLVRVGEDGFWKEYQALEARYNEGL